MNLNTKSNKRLSKFSLPSILTVDHLLDVYAAFRNDLSDCFLQHLMIFAKSVSNLVLLTINRFGKNSPKHIRLDLHIASLIDKIPIFHTSIHQLQHIFSGSL